MKGNAAEYQKSKSQAKIQQQRKKSSKFNVGVASPSQAHDRSSLSRESKTPLSIAVPDQSQQTHKPKVQRTDTMPYDSNRSNRSVEPQGSPTISTKRDKMKNSCQLSKTNSIVKGCEDIAENAGIAGATTHPQIAMIFDQNGQQQTNSASNTHQKQMSSRENAGTMENVNSKDAKSGAFQLDPGTLAKNVHSTENIEEDNQVQNSRSKREMPLLNLNLWQKRQTGGAISDRDQIKVSGHAPRVATVENLQPQLQLSEPLENARLASNFDLLNAMLMAQQMSRRAFASQDSKQQKSQYIDKQQHAASKQIKTYWQMSQKSGADHRRTVTHDSRNQTKSKQFSRTAEGASFSPGHSFKFNKSTPMTSQIMLAQQAYNQLFQKTPVQASVPEELPKVARTPVQVPAASSSQIDPTFQRPPPMFQAKMKLDVIKASELALATETDKLSSMKNEVTTNAEPLSADFFERNERSLLTGGEVQFDCKGSSTHGMMSLDQGDVSLSAPFAPITSHEQVQLRSVLAQNPRRSYNLDIQQQLMTTRSKISQMTTGRAQDTIRVENHTEADRPFIMDADQQAIIAQFVTGMLDFMQKQQDGKIGDPNRPLTREEMQAELERQARSRANLMARNEDELMLEEYVKQRVHQPWHSTFGSARIPEVHQFSVMEHKRNTSTRNKSRQQQFQSKLKQNAYVSRADKANRLIFGTMDQTRNHAAAHTAPATKHMNQEPISISPDDGQELSVSPKPTIYTTHNSTIQKDARKSGTAGHGKRDLFNLSVKKPLQGQILSHAHGVQRDISPAEIQESIMSSQQTSFIQAQPVGELPSNSIFGGQTSGHALSAVSADFRRNKGNTMRNFLSRQRDREQRENFNVLDYPMPRIEDQLKNETTRSKLCPRGARNLLRAQMRKELAMRPYYYKGVEAAQSQHHARHNTISYLGESYLRQSIQSGQDDDSKERTTDDRNDQRPMTTQNEPPSMMGASLSLPQQDQQIMSAGQLEDPNISYMCMQMKQKYLLSKRLLSQKSTVKDLNRKMNDIHKHLSMLQRNKLIGGMIGKQDDKCGAIRKPKMGEVQNGGLEEKISLRVQQDDEELDNLESYNQEYMPSHRDDGAQKHLQRSVMQFSRHQKYRISVSQNVKRRTGSTTIDGSADSKPPLASQISNMKLFQRVEDIIQRKMPSTKQTSQNTSVLGGKAGDMQVPFELIDLKSFLEEQASTLTPKRSSMILDMVKNNSYGPPTALETGGTTSGLITGSHIVQTSKRATPTPAGDGTHASQFVQQTITLQSHDGLHVAEPSTAAGRSRHLKTQSDAMLQQVYHQSSQPAVIDHADRLVTNQDASLSSDCVASQIHASRFNNTGTADHRASMERPAISIDEQKPSAGLNETQQTVSASKQMGDMTPLQGGESVLAAAEESGQDPLNLLVLKPMTPTPDAVVVEDGQITQSPQLDKTKKTNSPASPKQLVKHVQDSIMSFKAAKDEAIRLQEEYQKMSPPHAKDTSTVQSDAENEVADLSTIRRKKKSKADELRESTVRNSGPSSGRGVRDFPDYSTMFSVVGKNQQLHARKSTNLDKLLGIRENQGKSQPMTALESAKHSQEELQSRFQSNLNENDRSAAGNTSTVHEAAGKSITPPLMGDEPMLTFRGSLKTMDQHNQKSQAFTKTATSRVGIPVQKVNMALDELTKAHVRELQEFHEQASSREPTRRAVVSTNSPKDTHRYQQLRTMQGSLLLSSSKLDGKRGEHFKALDSNSPASRDQSPPTGDHLTNSPIVQGDNTKATDAFKELSQHAMTSATGTQADVLSQAMRRMQPQTTDSFGARLNLKRNFLLKPSESHSQRQKQNIIGKSILTKRAQDAKQRLEFIEKITRRAMARQPKSSFRVEDDNSSVLSPAISSHEMQIMSRRTAGPMTTTFADYDAKPTIKDQCELIATPLENHVNNQIMQQRPRTRGLPNIHQQMLLSGEINFKREENKEMVTSGSMAPLRNSNEHHFVMSKDFKSTGNAVLSEGEIAK